MYNPVAEIETVTRMSVNKKALPRHHDTLVRRPIRETPNDGATEIVARGAGCVPLIEKPPADDQLVEHCADARARKTGQHADLQSLSRTSRSA